MHNYTQQNTQHQFLIHGGDKRGTKRVFWIALGLLPILGALIWWLGDTGFWIGSVSYIVAIVGCFWWLGSGQSERYVVTIDTEGKWIRATDRIRGIQLWEDDFHIEWVQVSEIQVLISGESYRHPALVYAEEKVDLIIDAVPTSTRILLGLGEKAEIESVYEVLTGESTAQS